MKKKKKGVIFSLLLAMISLLTFLGNPSTASAEEEYRHVDLSPKDLKKTIYYEDGYIA